MTITIYSDRRIIQNPLPGAKLVSATKVDDEIVIVTDRGVLRGVPEGGCCSNSWIESVECDAPEGSVFTDQITSDNRDCDWADGDENKVYFGTFYTDRGRIMWEMRNTSNGYYGGWINWEWTPV